MLFNYIKITLAVMRRRKFFTFISMFGISFTLLILILLTAFFDHLLGPNYPEWNRNQMVYIQMLQEKDSAKGWSRSGPVSFSFAQRYVKTLKTPAKVSIATTPNTINAYAGGKKLKLRFRHTDAEFWEVAQFEFLEGRPYTQQDIDQNAYDIVINDRVRDDYFGKGAQAVGKTMEIDNVTYRVTGVVRGCPMTRINTMSDVWMPYNTIKYDLKNPEFNGSFSAMLLARPGENPERISAEYAEVIAKLRPSVPEYDLLISSADGFTGSFTRNMVGDQNDSGLRMFFILLSAFALLFMLIPALNLVNLNISRILERTSEIGVRRACGASAKQLVVQFTVENVLIAIIGGIAAIVLAAVFIQIFNSSDLFPYADFRINWRVAGIAFILSVLFGLMSGVYPAWRMSKLAPAEALKSGEN
jgi:putative ABC transport system permease protein